MYKGSDHAINDYLHHCINKFENLSDLQGIADAMHSFAERYVALHIRIKVNRVFVCNRKDFDIQWYHDNHNPNFSVFSLLHNMANNMLQKSIKLHEMGKYFKPSTVYQRMLWSKFIIIQSACFVASVMLHVCMCVRMLHEPA